MGAQSVKIPVELELTNIQGKINELQNALSHVKPGTAAYKSLNTILQQIQRQYNAIDVESKKAFQTPGQIKHFSSSVERLGNLTLTFQERLAKVGEEDLDIDLTEINSAIEKIKSLNAELEKIKEHKVENIFKGTKVGKVAEDLGINISKNTTFDGLVKSFEDAAAKIQGKANKLKSDLEDIKEKQIKQKDFSGNLDTYTQVIAEETSVRTPILNKGVRTKKMGEFFSKRGFSESFITDFSKKRDAAIDTSSPEKFIESAQKEIVAAVNERKKQVEVKIKELEEQNERLQKALSFLKGKSGEIDSKELGKGGVLEGLGITKGTSAEDAARRLSERSTAGKDNIATLQAESRALAQPNIERSFRTFANDNLIKKTLDVSSFNSRLKTELSAIGVTESIGIKEGEGIDSFITRLTTLLTQKSTILESQYQDIITNIKNYESQIESITGTNGAVSEVHATEGNLSVTIEQKEKEIAALQKQLEEAQGKIKEQVRQKTQVPDFSPETGGIQAKIDDSSSQLVKKESLNNMQMMINRWFGLNDVIGYSKQLFRTMINDFRELDKVMTEIAVVTDMTQKDLWNQMSAYSSMAKEYGSSIKGVYEVSQLWYQQGLQTNEVMKLTEETLKMVKIAGIDYSKATDYMTVALRGFKMEMEDAQRVVDVYSRIAAITASDTQELAEAMSKTASSAEAVGSSFENTTAMIALMVNFLPLIIERLY